MDVPSVYDAVRRANARTRGLVSHYGLDPVYASRVYLLNAVTRTLALQSSGAKQDDDLVHLVIFANIIVLNEVFPGDPLITVELEREAEEISGYETAVDSIRSYLVGRRRDGALRASQVSLPSHSLAWRSLENRPPIRPSWGDVEPFGSPIPAAKDICPAPPQPGSPEHMRQLDLVRQAVTNINSDELTIVLRWACSIGSEGPSGQWQALLESELMRQGDYSRSLYVLTLAEIAMFNAGIACWRTKFHYWFPRPSNMDCDIPVHIHLPNFPSYTSGHSSFSWAVVGSVGEVFPELVPRLAELAEEASWSRVLAGVHYPADCDSGKTTGLNVGRATARRLNSMEVIASHAKGRMV